jgi:hypothetical protein
VHYHQHGLKCAKDFADMSEKEIGEEGQIYGVNTVNENNSNNQAGN